jgi:polyisoprenoid-binding protein YceI
MNSISTSVLFAGCLGLSLATACQNPAKDKPIAEVAEAVKPSAQVAATAAAGKADTAAPVTYLITPADSKISFVGAKVTRKHDGSFGAFTGTVRVPNGTVEQGSVTAEADVASMTSDDPKLTGHLKSPDFFDAEKFPKVRFTSTSIQAGGAAGATHTITGNLELKGVTKSVRFPATVQLAADSIKVNAEFGINRKDWGIVYPGMPDDLIRDEVLIRLAIDAKKG